MGSWGYKLYENDLSLDIKDTLKDMLTSGYQINDIITYLKEQFLENFDEELDAKYYFWIVIADTLWQAGYYRKSISQKAIKSIDQYLLLLNNENPVYSEIKDELLDIKSRIIEKPPKHLKIKKKPYICPWKIGDTFAYQIENPSSDESSLLGQFIIIRKIGSDKSYKGKILPFVEAKITTNGKIPESIDELNGLEFIQTGTSYEQFQTTGYQQNINQEFCFDDYGLLPVYPFTLYGDSIKQIPAKLIYVGNYQKIKEPVLNNHFIDFASYSLIPWNQFEELIIYYYHNFSLKNAPFYNKFKK